MSTGKSLVNRSLNQLSRWSFFPYVRWRRKQFSPYVPVRDINNSLKVICVELVHVNPERISRSTLSIISSLLYQEINLSWMCVEIPKSGCNDVSTNRYFFQWALSCLKNSRFLCTKLLIIGLFKRAMTVQLVFISEKASVVGTRKTETLIFHINQISSR